VAAHEPVSDWCSDYDIVDPDFARDPFPVWAELRQSCPVAHSERWGGSWMLTRHDDLSAVAHDSEHFSSISVSVSGNKPGMGGLLVLPPITSDPPEHGPARRRLLPAFSVKAVAKFSDLTRDYARELLADIVGRGDGRVDGAKEYAQRIPVRVIATMLGVPHEDEEQFTHWVIGVLQTGDESYSSKASHELLDYFKVKTTERRADPDPPDDILTYLLGVRDEDGQPMEEKHLLGSCLLLLVAGVDTTWSSIGSSLWHLATHPADRERLVADPALIPTAIEELLRAYAPVTMARIVTAEVEVGGRTLCPGERVLLPFPAGNRDPDNFEEPDRVLIDRAVNRHAAFGLGIHRCLGSNLARMELRVALEEWLAAIPSFRLADGADVEWNGGQVRGPRSIPLQFP
jgi:cytochrome P450